jgi:hypothetical protein
MEQARRGEAAAASAGQANQYNKPVALGLRFQRHWGFAWAGRSGRRLCSL